MITKSWTWVVSNHRQSQAMHRKWRQPGRWCMWNPFVIAYLIQKLGYIVHEVTRLLFSSLRLFVCLAIYRRRPSLAYQNQWCMHMSYLCISPSHCRLLPPISTWKRMRNSNDEWIATENKFNPFNTCHFVSWPEVAFHIITTWPFDLGDDMYCPSLHTLLECCTWLYSDIMFLCSWHSLAFIGIHWYFKSSRVWRQ